MRTFTRGIGTLTRSNVPLVRATPNDVTRRTRAPPRDHARGMSDDEEEELDGGVVEDLFGFDNAAYQNSTAQPTRAPPARGKTGTNFVKRGQAPERSSPAASAKRQRLGDGAAELGTAAAADVHRRGPL